jgi:signal transduction histidine kinase
VLKFEFTRSITTQLAIANVATLGATILLMSAVFYFGTLGALYRGLDGKIVATSDRLFNLYSARPVSDLAQEVERDLRDDLDRNFEIFQVASADGRPLAGNMSNSGIGTTPYGRLIKRQVIRSGRPTSARLIIRQLPSGALLYVGRDLSEEQPIRVLVWRALRVAVVVAVALAILVALLFRRHIAARIGEIRRTASQIEAGDLMSRIKISGDDEFARLSVDINRMLDRIETLVDGVRHVSNAIAHDLRTPLAHIRGRLDEALRREPTAEALSLAAEAAIEGIDELVLVFQQLLQIAEAEAGPRTKAFEHLDLSRIIKDMAELYDAVAEAERIKLRVGSRNPVWAHGDPNLLKSAVASLIDNAIKYAGPGCRVVLFAYCAPEGAMIVVQDNGPGVPTPELSRLSERFYRVDRARSLPGNGLGLGIVSAIATLHGGKLLLTNLKPGFQAAIILPTPAVETSVQFTRAQAEAS